jgi:hypothetical protein
MMPTIRSISLHLLCGSSILLSGCLTVGEKEYRIHLSNANSGTAVIRFIDIGSETEDTTDASFEDFHHLIESYLEGDHFETENPGFRNATKSLYEENGVLSGQIRFEFDSLDVVRLYRFDDESPYMYYVGSELLSEELVETNGQYGGARMPVIFWPKETKDFMIRTRISTETPYRKSLVPHFREWQGQKREKVRPENQED